MIKILLVALALTIIAAGLLGFLRNLWQVISGQKTIQTTQYTTLKTPPQKFNSMNPGDYTRQVPGWNDRSYLLHIPTGYDSAKPMPVILAIHGGGGDSERMNKLTCPGGDLSNPKCLSSLADQKGFIVVYPNGTRSKLLYSAEIRTWNAGGGTNGYSCVSGVACKNKVDDIAYFKALLGDLKSTVNVDSKRIYATGISNGAAMSHRLACELADKIAAIGPIAGGNQFGATANCNPSRPVPVLEIHGTADPGWPYNGGENQTSLWNYFGATPGNFFPIPQTVSDWAKRNGCDYSASAIRDEVLPTIVNDGTTVTVKKYPACKNGADVVFYKIENGGHTWPDGYQYFPEASVGKTTHNLNANEVMWDFFQAHPLQ